MNVIEVNNVSKSFKRHAAPKLIRERVFDLFRRKPEETFYALKDVSFRVAEGESVALIGANGAGKSTTLSLITGLARPDEGSIQTQGRIAALLELGSGFHPDLTGEENVLLNAALLGMSSKVANSKLSSIVEFSELTSFIHEPLRTYSSGMVVRLAFSIAVHIEPSVLIVDEVLGVGDSHFQQKSLKKVEELRNCGNAMLCVSHNPGTIRRFCDRAIWLHKGVLMMDDAVDVALDAYTSFLSQGEMSQVDPAVEKAI